MYPKLWWLNRSKHHWPLSCFLFKWTTILKLLLQTLQQVSLLNWYSKASFQPSFFLHSFHLHQCCVNILLLTSCVIFMSVCQPNVSDYQCICEDGYAWSYNNCQTYEACGNISFGSCGCISRIPSEGEMCVLESGKNDDQTNQQ